MLFTHPIFLIFFVIVFALHWSLRRNTHRKTLLLIASYIFYGSWDWRFLFLIFASTLIDYIVGLQLAGPYGRAARKRLLLISIGSNLGILGFFKYYNFFVTSAGSLLDLLGIPVEEATLNIVLPVGISFFTFQSMSYTFDIYRGTLKPVRSFSDFALFVSFFPQLVAGPIVRASAFLPQLALERRLSNIPFKWCFSLFLIGYFKKACVADNIAIVVDGFYETPLAYDRASIWIVMILYTVQIYCDFSGYSDMAIAIARFFGFNLPLNFRFPLIAFNIREFWRRWHISLSTWLRDNLYIPLGGNRGGNWYMYRNLMLTMLLGGLWHGASWNFVIWGGLHGIALVVHRLYTDAMEVPFSLRRVMAVIGFPLTFFWAAMAFIFFRAQTLVDAMALVSGLFLLDGRTTQTLSTTYLLWMIPLLLLHVISYRKPIEDRVQVLPSWVCAIGFGLILGIILLFVPLHFRPFVYFQF